MAGTITTIPAGSTRSSSSNRTGFVADPLPEIGVAIQWNAGGPLGKLSWEIFNDATGQPEQAERELDPAPINPHDPPNPTNPPPKTGGSTGIQAKVDHTYTLRVRIGGPGFPIAISSIIKVERAFDPRQLNRSTFWAEVDAGLMAFGLIQQIRNFQVLPAANSAIFNFETVQACNPMIQWGTEPVRFRPDLGQFEIPTGKINGSWLKPPARNHSIRITGLDAETSYNFVIVADSVTPQRRIAQRTGSFTTTMRIATLTVTKIIFWRVGDASSPGDIALRMSLFDGPGGFNLTPQSSWPRMGIRGGQTVPVNKTWVVPNAPSPLTLWVDADDDDTIEFGVTYWLGLDEVQYTSPPGSVRAPGEGEGERGSSEFTAAQHDFDLPEVPTGGVQEDPFEFTSMDGALRFTVYGTLKVEEPRFAPQLSPAAPTHRPGASYATAGGRLAGVLGNGRRQIFALGPNDSVLEKAYYVGAAGQPRNEWRLVGERVVGPLTVVDFPRDRVTLIGRNADGAAMTKECGGAAYSSDAGGWHAIGGAHFVGPFVAARNDNRTLHLFAIGEDQAIHYRPLVAREDPTTPPQRASWRSLGGRVRDSLSVRFFGEGQIEVFAIGDEGDVVHLSVRLQTPAEPSQSWTSLGGHFTGPTAVVPVEDGHLHVFAITGDGRVMRRLWNLKHGMAEAGGWTDVGDIDTFSDRVRVPPAVYAK